MLGFAKGVGGLGWHPIKGLYLSGQALTHHTSRGVSTAHQHYVIKYKRSKRTSGDKAEAHGAQESSWPSSSG